MLLLLLLLISHERVEKWSWFLSHRREGSLLLLGRRCRHRHRTRILALLLLRHVVVGLLLVIGKLLLWLLLWLVLRLLLEQKQSPIVCLVLVSKQKTNKKTDLLLLLEHCHLLRLLLLRLFAAVSFLGDDTRPVGG